MTAIVDERNADAKARLLFELMDSKAGWLVSTEQELTGTDLFVVRLAFPHVEGHVTIEASGHRSAGGYEYLVTVFDSLGTVRRGPSSFSMTPHALHWARVWLLER